MKLRYLSAFIALSFLSSCSQGLTGRIYFDLNGGVFLDNSFSTNYLSGQSGTPVKVNIPDPYKEGYYFVGWREKTKEGAYREINKRRAEDGNAYYYYPYGSDTFYAYFEPLVTYTFDLGISSEDGGSFVAPLYDATSFSNNKLNGYASKTIPNTDYLPTAVSNNTHLHFQYWYLEYPLVSSIDEQNLKHYSLDTTQEKGEYRFDKAFGTDYMSFLLDKDTTLYAKWEEDTTITVHFNMNDMEDYSFQGNTSIETELIDLMYEKFRINLNEEAEYYYYPRQSKNFRFHGFYLDEEFTQPFPLNSSIASTDFDLYLSWEKRVTVTLDYNGGEVSSESSHTFSNTYYENDILGAELLEQFTPTRGDADFSYYTLEGVEFIFDRTPLPDHDITLVAQYNSYPSLTLHYDYPDNYLGDKLNDFTYHIKSGSDITDVLDSFKAAVNAPSLSIENFYIKDADKKEPFSFVEMPLNDLEAYLLLNYRSKYQVQTYYNPDTSYILLEDSTVVDYLDSTLKEEDLASLKDRLNKEDVIYLFDGFYSDDTLSKTLSLPLSTSTSHEQVNQLNLYRKMSKAIILTFYDYTTRDPLNLSLPILKGKRLVDYEGELHELLGDYQRLVIDDGGVERTISSILPSSDTIVYVER